MYPYYDFSIFSASVDARTLGRTPIFASVDVRTLGRILRRTPGRTLRTLRKTLEGT